MIFITGDTHGDYSDFVYRIAKNDIPYNSTIIVCGDFGFVWNVPFMKSCLQKLIEMPYTFLFIDGNHEDFDLLNTYPVVENFGGSTHKIADNIYHLMRGQRFELEGKSFFTFGGAYSIDKQYRIEGKTWWKDELPTNADYDTAERTLEKCGYKVDYVLTHTIPQSAVYLIGAVPDQHDAELTGYFDWLFTKLEFKEWFAGHFHVDKIVMNKLHILYNDMIKLENELFMPEGE